MKKRKKWITIEPEPRVKVVLKKVVLKRDGEDLRKHQDNIRTLLVCSNATPIRRYGGGGYTCCFCPQRFPEAAQLKSHTLQSHDNTVKSTFIGAHNLQEFLVKLDITGLRCHLCQQPHASIEEITSHLLTTHKKTYHQNLKSQIIPFIFTEPLHCAICTQNFSNFKVLLQHMNVHFRNHICDVCGNGFVNKKVFRTHMYRHETGVFNCSICAKVFDNRVKCKEHELAMHVRLNRRSKCGYCGQMFSDYTKKNQHEVKSHGAKAVVLLCRACDKSFDNQRALTVHTKTHHMLEKRVPILK